MRNTGLLEKAESLWHALTSGQLTAKDKLLVVGALLYLISPVDLIPDTIPVIGWLDDLGVAAFVLNYLHGKLDAQTLDQPIAGTSTLTSLSGADAPPTAGPAGSPSFATTEPASYSSLAYRCEGLRQIAADAGVEAIAEAAEDLSIRLDGGYARVVFAGRYNTGKSTLINALLGRPLLPTGPVPTTRGIIYVLHGAEECLFSQDGAGEITTHGSVGELLEPGNTAVAASERVCLFVPAPVLEGDVCLIDSPGLEEPGFDRSILTLREIPEADALVLVLDTVGISAPEQRFVEDLLRADRQRKLLVVLNKTDRHSPGEIKELVGSVRAQFAALGLQPRIFPLSATAATLAAREGGEVPAGFTNFRDELRAFLLGQVGSERRRAFEHRFSELGGTLRAACRNAQAFEATDEAGRQQASQEARESEVRAREEDIRQREHLEARLDAARRRFDANLQNFFYELERDVRARVADADLDALRKTDDMERFVRGRTQEFVETQLAALQAEAGEGLAEIQNRLHIVQLGLPSGAPRGALSPEAVTPLLLVVAYPLMGIFSFLALCAAATLGRELLNDLVRQLMGAHGLIRLREQLASALGPKIVAYGEKVTAELDAHLRAWREQTLSRASTLAAEARAHVPAAERAATTDPDTAPRPPAAQLLERLERLGLPSPTGTRT